MKYKTGLVLTENRNKSACVGLHEMDTRQVDEKYFIDVWNSAVVQGHGNLCRVVTVIDGYKRVMDGHEVNVINSEHLAGV